MPRISHLVSVAVVLLAVGSTACGGSASERKAPATASPTVTHSTAMPLTPSTTAGAVKHFSTVQTWRATPGFLDADGGHYVLNVDGRIQVVRSDGSKLSDLSDIITTQGGFVGDTDPNHASTVRMSTTDSGQSFVYTVQTETTPARGVDAASTQYFLAAWSAQTGKKVWQTQIPAPPSPTLTTPPVVKTTSDGKWAVVEYEAHAAFAVIDAVTGAARPTDFGPYPIGAYIAHFAEDVCIHCDDGAGTLLDASTFAPRSAFTNPTGNVLRTATDVFFAHDAIVNAEGTLAISSDISVPNPAGNAYIADLATNSITRTIPSGGSWPIIDEKLGLVFLQRSGGGVASYDMTSGQQRWSVPTASRVCAAADGEVALIANGQMALLDENTGKQIDFTASIDTCGEVSSKYSLQGDHIVKLLD